MSYIDLFLGGFLIYGLIRGFWNGFFVELASFVSLVIGIYIAIQFSFITKDYLAQHVSWNPKTIQIVAFVFTFILVVFGISLLAKFLTRMASLASLGIVNKLAGGVFGMLKMMLLLSVSIQLFEKINIENAFAEKATLDNSLFYYPIERTAAFLYPAIKDGFMELKKSTF